MRDSTCGLRHHFVIFSFYDDKYEGSNNHVALMMDGPRATYFYAYGPKMDDGRMRGPAIKGPATAGALRAGNRCRMQEHAAMGAGSGQS